MIGLVAGQCVHQGQFVSVAIGIVAVVIVVMDQYKLFQRLKECKNLDQASITPFLERSQKITDVFKYQGLSIIFNKMTLLPTEQSKILSHKIAIDLNPDLAKQPPVGLLPIIYEYLRNIYHHNYLSRHLLLMDVNCLVLIFISLGFSWVKLDLTMQILIILTCLDMISCLFEVTEKHSEESIDGQMVFAKAGLRNIQMVDRYTNILMRE